MGFLKILRPHLLFEIEINGSRVIVEQSFCNQMQFWIILLL